MLVHGEGVNGAVIGGFGGEPAIYFTVCSEVQLVIYDAARSGEGGVCAELKCSRSGPSGYLQSVRVEGAREGSGVMCVLRGIHACSNNQWAPDELGNHN